MKTILKKRMRKVMHVCCYRYGTVRDNFEKYSGRERVEVDNENGELYKREI